MYAYAGLDRFIDNAFKGLFWISFYEVDSEKYGVTKGMTITFLGTNYNFEKKVK